MALYSILCILCWTGRFRVSEITTAVVLGTIVVAVKSRLIPRGLQPFQIMFWLSMGLLAWSLLIGAILGELSELSQLIDALRPSSISQPLVATAVLNCTLGALWISALARRSSATSCALVTTADIVVRTLMATDTERFDAIAAGLAGGLTFVLFILDLSDSRRAAG